MARQDGGGALPFADADIEWVEGSLPDPLATLTDDQRTLIEKQVRDAYTEGYRAGEVYGRKVGGQEALHAATEISTLLADRRWERAIETLRYFQQAIDEPSREPVF
jgi:hypothetical protein